MADAVAVAVTFTLHEARAAQTVLSVITARTQAARELASSFGIGDIDRHDAHSAMLKIKYALDSAGEPRGGGHSVF